MGGNRVLGAVRQSRTKVKVKGQRADPMSASAQRRQIQKWAGENEGEVIKFTEDLSTSGGKSCFKRPGLGPWLTEPGKAATWDTVVATKLDRLCRDLADYLKLAAWCDRNGKRLVVLDDPSLDTSSPSGRVMANVRASFAQYEREMAQVRNKERYAELVEQGRWPGGRPAYGWRYDEESGILVPDNGGRADILREMADLAISGRTNGQISVWLNDNGHLTGLGKKWRPDAVRLVLRADMTADLLGEAKAAELRAALRSRSHTSGERVGGHMLLRVAYCRQCNGPMYGVVGKARPKSNAYRCIPCVFRVSMPKLEEFTERSLLRSVGQRKLRERVLVPGDDHQAEIHRLEHEIDALEKISGTEAVVSMKRAEVEHLKNEPFTPDHFEFRRLDIRIADYWDALPPQDRGSFLRSWEVRVLADREGADIDLGLLDRDDDGFQRK